MKIPFFKTLDNIKFFKHVVLMSLIIISRLCKLSFDTTHEPELISLQMKQPTAKMIAKNAIVVSFLFTLVLVMNI